MQVSFLGENVTSLSLLSAKFSDAINNEKLKHVTVFILVIILKVSKEV